MQKSAETTYRALLLDVMVAMMEIDGTVDEREMATIGDVYENVVGFRLTENMRTKLMASVAITRLEVLDLLRTRHHLLSESQKENLLRAAVLVLRSDLAAHPREWQFLREVGLAVGMSDEEMSRRLI